MPRVEMSSAAFQAFQARVDSDPQLQQQLSAAAEAYAAAVVAIAREAGFTISAEEVQAAQLSQGGIPLSDDDVEGLSGGVWYSTTADWSKATQATWGTSAGWAP